MLEIFATVIILFGVILVYDARPITLRYFNFGKENESTTGLKILGFLIAIIGAVLLYICIR